MPTSCRAFRWTECARQLREQQQCLTGDLLLASAVLSYLGPFTAAYRDELTEKWTMQLAKVGENRRNDLQDWAPCQRLNRRHSLKHNPSVPLCLLLLLLPVLPLLLLLLLQLRQASCA